MLRKAARKPADAERAKPIERPVVLLCWECGAPLAHGVCPDCPAPRDEYDPIDDRRDIDV
jgi:rubrerythrin